MKLLSPREAAVSQEKKQADDIAQISLLRSTLARLQKQANEEEEAFQARLREQREAYGKEKDTYKGELRDLDNAVKLRRDELGVLMQPIDAVRKEAEGRMTAAIAKEAIVAASREEAEELIRTAQQKIDDLSTREGILVEGERSLSLRKEGIDVEAKMVSEGHKTLNSQITAFREKQSKRSAELSAFEVDVSARKLAHDKLFNEQNERLRLREVKIEEEWVRIADERKVVQRIWNQLENKKGI